MTGWRQNRVYRFVGIAVLGACAIALGIGAILTVGYLAWLFAKLIIVASWHAIVEGIKDSVSGKS